MSSSHASAPVVYSLVIPVLNEEEVLPLLYARLAAVLPQLDGAAEIIFVDDGSTDATLAVLRGLRVSDDRVKILSFSRNFGHQAAISAGMDYSAGEAIIIMDADLQDPPELILDMAAKWHEGYEVVYAEREQRHGESFFKRATAKVFYRLMRALTQIDIPMNVGDYRLIGRAALTALTRMRERNRFIRGMVSWVGFRQTSVRYARDPRRAGTTKYPLRKMVKFALDGITSFSWVPLRIATYIGFLAALISLVLVIWVIDIKLGGHQAVPGWASQMLAILFLGSVQLITLGILGEYIGRIYDEVRGRPLYIVAEAYGAQPEEERTSR